MRPSSLWSTAVQERFPFKAHLYQSKSVKALRICHFTAEWKSEDYDTWFESKGSQNYHRQEFKVTDCQEKESINGKVIGKGTVVYPYIV